jgi:parallel beta-helix repeat protein
MIKHIVLLGFLNLIFSAVFATKYYCDPIKGNMQNKGTYDSPWSRLDSVFLSNKKLSPGDTIFLRSGFHGYPLVKGNLATAGYITILPQSGHCPKVNKITIAQAQRWKIIGLKVNPEVINSYDRGDFVAIKSTASFIIIEKFNISSTDSCIHKWSASKLLSSYGLGIRVDGTDCILNGNTIKQVSFGISVSKTATRTKVSNNIIYGFINDGMRGLSDDSIFEYNLIAGCYGIDDNHDDGFQSWSTNETGKVGMGKVSNVVLRGNIFISQLDPAQPFPQERGMQGIGNFDGFFENWIVEDNLIMTNMWHGISFYGAINCKISNNTVLSNPLNKKPFTPWMGVYDHKKLGASSGNRVSNNLTTGLSEMKGVVEESNNIKIPNEKLADYFENWNALELKIKPNKKSKILAGADLSIVPKIDKKLYACTDGAKN